MDVPNESPVNTNQKSGNRSHRKQPKPRGRPKVAKNKAVCRTKQRGKYRKTEDTTLGICDPDLAACIFPDDEMRADYMEDHMPQIGEEDFSTIDDISKQDTSVPDDTSRASSTENPLPSTSRAGAHDSSTPTADVSNSDHTVDSVNTSSRDVSSAFFRESMCSPVLSRSGVEIADTLAQHHHNLMFSLENVPSSSTPRKVHKGLEVLEGAFTSPTCEERSIEVCSSLIEAGLAKFRELLTSPWVPIADREGFHLLFLSRGQDKAIQREIFIAYNGKVTIKVHCVHIVKEKAFLSPPLPLFSHENLEKFCETCCAVVKLVMRFNVCIGANHMMTRSAWSMVSHSYIDSNPYLEDSYTETCRSLSCVRLVEVGIRSRCSECAIVMKSLTGRKEFILSDSANSNTPNIFLTKSQAEKKLKIQHEEIRKKDQQILYLRKKVQTLLDTEAVELERDLSEDLSAILSKCNNVTPLQKTFLEEQMKCSRMFNFRK